MSKTVYVSVEVDFSEFDTDDLKDELKSRGVDVGESDMDDQLDEMFYAFKLNRLERALEIARQIAEGHKGAIL